MSGEALFWLLLWFSALTLYAVTGIRLALADIETAIKDLSKDETKGKPK